MNLRERIAARIDALEELATVNDPGCRVWRVVAKPGEATVVDDNGHTVCERIGDYNTALSIAAWSPENVLSELAEDRDVLERHANEGYPGFGPDLCGWCSEETEEGQIRVRWPCAEIRSLARRRRVEIEEGNGGQ